MFQKLFRLRKHRSSSSICFPYIFYFLTVLLFIVCLFISDLLPKRSQIFFENVYDTFKQLTWENILTEKYIRVHFVPFSYVNICKNDDQLLIYVLSTLKNSERRNHIRKTWANKKYHSMLSKTCFIFIVGTQASGMDTENYQKHLNNEQQLYNDIVQINHRESYQNVVYKEISALQWSYKYYRFIPFLFKTDDDLIIDSIFLSSIVHSLIRKDVKNTYADKNRPHLMSSLVPINHKAFFKGWGMGQQPTLREGKFGISLKVWPHEILPPYCSGFGFIMSSGVRDRLYRASLFYRTEYVAWIGDVFISGFLARVAQVQCTEFGIDYEQTGSKNCSCLMKKNSMLTVCSTVLHMGIEEYDEYEKAWKFILQRHQPIAANETENKDEKC
ncbi:unnamed protein product [Didymodactylos carnosus]|uniref:Hexosyltransferase n=1 Tax=Didymodactylos carnosus TaxID=1234261 RepID=A0A8S2JKQ9_9BILA|nr:unnamed protein product [Didymodactylos carnosus]CAF3812504.1 unnamed protein product [Didymodactylos carnosus]